MSRVALADWLCPAHPVPYHAGGYSVATDGSSAAAELLLGDPRDSGRPGEIALELWREASCGCVAASVSVAGLGRICRAYPTRSWHATLMITAGECRVRTYHPSTDVVSTWTPEAHLLADLLPDGGPVSFDAHLLHRCASWIGVDRVDLRRATSSALDPLAVVPSRLPVLARPARWALIMPVRP